MESAKINIGNNQNERIITKELKINKNVFIYNETVIQLCNISRISVADEAKEKYQLSTFVMILIGLGLLTAESTVAILIGLALTAVGGWLIYRTYKINNELGEYLVLNLNSGRNIYLHSNSHDFTIEVMDVIINCINSGKEYRVNMENCQIETCQFMENHMMKEEG